MNNSDNSGIQCQLCTHLTQDPNNDTGASEHVTSSLHLKSNRKTEKKAWYDIYKMTIFLLGDKNYALVPKIIIGNVWQA